MEDNKNDVELEGMMAQEPSLAEISYRAERG